MIELERMDPEVRPKLSRLRPINVGSPVMRLLFAVLPHVMPSHRVSGVALTTDRAGSVPVRIYRPDKATGAGLLWIHGGGLVGGVAKMDDRFCGETAQQLGVTIVSVEYRVAPKFPFPAGLDDVHAAFTWFLDHAAAWGVDPARIVVGGQSAGGGLAAALVQRLYDEGRHVAAQWLWCPMLDDRTALNTELDAVGHLVWDNRANRYGWGSYLRAVDRQAPLRTPHRVHGTISGPAPDMACTPPTSSSSTTKSSTTRLASRTPASTPRWTSSPVSHTPSRPPCGTSTPRIRSSARGVPGWAITSDRWLPHPEQPVPRPDPLVGCRNAALGR